MFSYFRLFAALVINPADKDISTLRTDGGGEYKSNEFKNFLQEREIRHQLSCAHNPSQNGVVEPANGTVIESVRSMIHSSKAMAVE